ncbi:carbohydrate-binding family 9-like protein [Dyadobacter sandarakinus]|uniref:Carbohydrate-binding family 9-like protein n=1 Tax=Dyadobacter sandarakinus TaxID=2747268 RepID=A0ABX7IEN0_9BACT|nr:carbohydrate-binding family 9-like protein [Dyadobacter sandarakinus]
MIIDGKLSESDWKKVEWTPRFVDIEGDKKPLPLQNTQVKMLWDNDYLYIAAVMEEEHIWAYQDKKDQVVFLENDFEVFIDPDGDTDNYYELEINAINNSFDLFLPKPYRKGGKPDIKWNIEGLKSAVSIEGTLNNAADTDKQWTLEIAIPFKSLSTGQVAAVMPQDGTSWRINFSRVNWRHETDKDGRYMRSRNAETNKVLPEYNWVWSPQGIINMHYPEYWGYLHFKAEKARRKKLR